MSDILDSNREGQQVCVKCGKIIRLYQVKDRVAVIYSGLVGLNVVAQQRYVHGHCFDPRKWDRWEEYFDKVHVE